MLEAWPHGVAAWREAWSTLAITEPARTLKLLIEKYNEPHRAYHNLVHIEECFAALETARHLAQRLAEVQLALWFHDAVYEPRASDNEQASADLAQRSLHDAGVERDAICRIDRLIMATRHDAPVTDDDARLVSDVDLWILASPPGRFEEYQAQIRQEYSWMAEDDFRLRRVQILRGFLDSSAIYQTEWFRSRLEESARKNISGELAAGAD